MLSLPRLFTRLNLSVLLALVALAVVIMMLGRLPSAEAQAPDASLPGHVSASSQAPGPALPQVIATPYGSRRGLALARTASA